ncbi:RAD55 family ATPase [Ornithobacterium rhinotracheale]|uniref:RAD55 family ATPase n=1 Tax=Ornithobacterium rhinotracheale TaxID=28251 RepID=UPI003FA4D088
MICESPYITRMCDISLSKSLFENFETNTALDSLLCSYNGLPKGVNYMIIGDPGSGKTTVVLDLLANLMQAYKDLRVLFISAEMNEVDLAIYVQRFPKFRFINILFINEKLVDNENEKVLHLIDLILNEGWDIVAIDSFYELQGMIKEDENITMKEAESRILALIKQNNKANNKRKLNTTFLSIQQVTKSGNFMGSNRLKQSITAMMELRFDNPKNIYSDRYIVFSKHRRGDVGVKLYYNLGVEGDVYYDVERLERDRETRQTYFEISKNLKNYSDKFDQLFSND